jgi:Domain of unknown function (DUF4395)
MTARALFSFPNPVNEVSARLVAAGACILAVVALATQVDWLLAALAYGFVARALTGPTLSPLGQVVTRVLTPRVRAAPRYAPGPAKRFAQSIGAVLTVTAAVLALGFGDDREAYALVAVLAVFAFLEAALGLCVGCKVLALLIRAGVVPAGVCRECANVWGR